MKKCILVNCFASSSEMRVEPIREVFNEKGYNTIYISSDYHHTLKKHIKLDDSITPIHVKAYKKNISFSRLLSHYNFSKKVYKILCKEQPDVLYIKFPPNSLVKMAYEYKRRFRCKIILDVFDLWPESLPIPNKIKWLSSPMTRVWANYRNGYIQCADLVLLECAMYKKEIEKVLPSNSKVLYLSKRDIDYKFYSAEKGKMRLCFIGGINNIINIELIGRIIKQFSRYYTVTLDIIGDGINKNSLMKVAEDNGATVTYHGIIYDEKRKSDIMLNCDLGLNLVKPSTKIALSIKSIEYFRSGLGIINNVPFDTYEIIERYGAGINIGNMDKNNTQLTEVKQINNIKCASRRVYEELFSINNVQSLFKDYLKDLDL